MSTTTITYPKQGLDLPVKNYLNVEIGLRSWLTTTDHKRIGLLYLISTLSSLILGGIAALLVRIELLTPGPTIVDAQMYDRLFTMHGVIMVWMFMIPAIPAGFGNILLPLMLGAKDVAFPRLNLASWYFYVAGAALVLYGVVWGGADAGWTFYPPYSSTAPGSGITWVALGVFVLGISTIITGVNFIVTTHTMRAEGMGWMRIPLFVWAIYATAIVQTLATPVLGMSLLLVALNHAFHLGIFNPAMGGDPILYQHMFWFYSHPAVYITVLPAMGVASEVVCAFSHKNPLSYRAIAFSALGIAFVGFLTWGHHMFVAGESTLDVGIFSALSMFVAVFTGIKVFTWVGTMYKGSIQLDTPLIYFFEFILLLGIGGMTGVALASPSLDMHWHDTYFVVAHFHFVMVGAVMTMFLAAWHYWFPKMFGKMYPEALARIAALTVGAGFAVTFVPQFLLGNAGMPRRYYDYPPRFQFLHDVSTVGSWILAAGLFLTLGYLLWTLFWGPPSGNNPFGSRGFEWLTPSPPPKHNYEETPVITHAPHDYYAAEEEWEAQ